jgi:hypothetical protein
VTHAVARSQPASVTTQSLMSTRPAKIQGNGSFKVDEAAAVKDLGEAGDHPVIRVRGGGTGHVSIAGLACYRPGQRSQL